MDEKFLQDEIGRLKTVDSEFYDEVTINSGEHICLSEGSAIYIESAEYMPIVKALGHNRLPYRGNLYQSRYGKAKAEGKPNYRNRFMFIICKDNQQFYFTVFCNKSNPERALSKAINYVNENILTT